MKKHVILTVLYVSAIVTAFAQNFNNNLQLPNGKHQELQNHAGIRQPERHAPTEHNRSLPTQNGKTQLAPDRQNTRVGNQPIHTSEKTTAGNASRCIAEIRYTIDNAAHDFVPADSTIFIYSGSMPNFLFDFGYSFPYSSGSYASTATAKYSATYNSNRQMTLGLVQNWDGGSSTWVNTNQFIYTYDANSNPLTQLNQSWNSGTSTWVNSNQSVYTWDAMNNRLSELYQYWDAGTSTWKNNYQYVYTYDGYHNMLSEIYSYEIATTGILRNNYQYFYTYDGAHNQLSNLYQNWDTVAAAWVYFYKENSTFTGTNKIATVCSDYWNTATSQWRWDSVKTFLSYDLSDNNIYTIDKIWDSTSASWINNQATYNTFNSANKVTNITTLWWGGTGWDTGSKETDTYDGSNNLTADSYQYFQSSDSTWHNSFRYLYSGYYGTNCGTQIYQNWSDYHLAWSNIYEYNNVYNSFEQVTYQNSLTWDTVSGSWRPANNDYADRYYYETYYSVVPPICTSGGNALFYPNPAINNILLDITWNEPQAFTVSIIDNDGRLRTTWQVAATAHYNESVALDNLESGNYFIKMAGTKGSIVKQVSVVR